MIEDHRHLDKLLFNFLNEKDINESRILFQRLRDRFDKHFRIEDEILFPLFRKYLGVEEDTGLITKRHDEHNSILKLLDMLFYFLNTKNSEQFIATGHNFKKFLSKHQEREDKTEYSLYNNSISISDEEWEKKIKSIYGMSLDEIEKLRRI